MNLNLYDENFNRIAIIGNEFISCLWCEGYNTIESFSLELNESDDYKKKIRPDRYIGRSDRPTLMVIKSVEIRDNKIIVYGKQATRVLEDVAFVGTIRSGSNVDTSIANAYAESFGYPNFSFAESNLQIKYNHQISNKSISELCLIMCQDTDMGFRAVRNGSQAVIEFYRPEANPNLVFAEKFGNLSLDQLSFSREALKNYAIVLGMEKETGRVRVDVDNTKNDYRREIIIDARDLQQEEGESDEAYEERLADRGYEKLINYAETYAVKFTPDSSDFGKRYDLGDVLTVYLAEYGITLTARVKKFTQKEQQNTASISIDVGQVTITRR